MGIYNCTNSTGTKMLLFNCEKYSENLDVIINKLINLLKNPQII